MEKIPVCNIVRRCDTIKVHVPQAICGLSQPVVITASKNPLCKGKVNFTFDTSQVQSYTQINDTTISLIFNHNYTGRIFARPANCYQLVDSAEIQVMALTAQLNLGKDTIFCPGKNILLNAYNPYYKSYLWQDGSSDSILLAKESGVYYVTATDHCDRNYSDTILLIKKDFQLNLGKDSTICTNEKMLLTVPSGYLNYSWQPQNNITYINSYSVNVNPLITTSYAVEAEVIPGCKLSDTINIRVEDCQELSIFPIVSHLIVMD